ncbi:MAG: hypothetical protein FJ121_00120 [Deltaproteobacteria bacterium]|nr:hypothetical protein [Deltaproteobacteria bacterium]
MLKKGRFLWLTVVLLLAFAQPGLPALSAVGPVVPDADGDPLTPPWAPPFQLGAPTGFNGFPVWYRDSLGQTLVLAPGNPLVFSDPVDPLNPFSVQVGFGGEAMYWTGDATMPTSAGTADLGMALECTFNTGDPAPGEQIVFARIRIRIDTPIPGTYTVFHPYGAKTFSDVPAGIRGINDTSDIGIGAPGDFTGALNGQIGPFLRQVTGAPPGYIGDGLPALVTGSPIPSALHPSGFQNFFRVEGPPGSGLVWETDQIAVGGKFYDGTPYNITRATYNRSAAGVFADVFVTVPPPVPAGTAFRVRRPDQPAGSGVLMTRSQNQYYARVNFPAGLPANPTVVCTGTTPGFTPTVQSSSLVAGIFITKAEATLITGRPNRYNLNIEAFSTDVQAALTATGWSAAKVPMIPPAAPGAPWTLRVAGLAIPPATVTVQSAAGQGVQSNVMVVLP